MIFKIGDELGTILDHEISSTAAKIKVEINGLAPLTKQTLVEFSDGKEALVTLDYKNLKKHCFHCQRLSHEIISCPGLKKEKPSTKLPLPPPATRNSSPNRYASNYNLEKTRERTRGEFSSQARPVDSRGDYNSSKRRYEEKGTRPYNSSGSRTYENRITNTRRSPPKSLDYSRKTPSRSFSGQHYISHRPNLQWRERTTLPSEKLERSENSRTRRPPLERGSIAGESSPPIPRPVPSTEQIMGELREVTVQYTNCADPTESMARKQRVLQGEARGLMAETAAQIIAASTLTNAINGLTSEAQVPLSQSSDLPIHPAVLNDKGPVVNSPRRKTTGVSSTGPGESKSGTTLRKSAKQRLSLPEEEAGPSNAREPPPPMIIPAITKKKESAILEVILNYYQKLFTMQEVDAEQRRKVVQEALEPCISEEMNNKLITIPSAAEIKLACFSIHADKAPGPDGFSASFFQTNWNTVSSQLILESTIADNVLIKHEVLHYLHTSDAKKRCFMAVKTDMSKAYDRIEWDFVKMVLERLGFHHIWVNWIMQCIVTVSYSYLLNGSAQGTVNPQRGLRQGDPLSPYIFILCSEVLSGLCNRAQAENRITGIKVGKKSPRLNHLLFADDTMFFCKSDPEDCLTFMTILEKYELASGQMINPQKSAITFSAKTSSEVRTRVKEQLGIEKEGGLGKYLGLPELFGRKKKDLFSMIVDRIRQKACSWSSKFLSAAGKVIMLKSVLAAMPSYTMSCFKLPNSLEGGLGFRDLQSFNDALLAKVSWRILTNPSSLLARTLLGKYCHSTPFLASRIPSNTSHGWRGICIGRELLKSKLGRVLGDGKSTQIWHDPWLSLTAPSRPTGPAPESSHNLMVADLLTPDSLEWDREKIQKILPDWEQAILEIKISTLGASDSYAWLPSKNGVYTAKSGYYESFKEEAESEPLPQQIETRDFNWTKEIWNIQRRNSFSGR
ncbi:unnamed protein product [Arabidopsis halleri]